MKKDRKQKKAKGRGPGRGGPMQVTASSAYAIHGLGYLAWKRDRPIIFLAEIAEFFEIPATYLAKVFQALSQASLVKSFRGARGGYSLARPGSEITFREVIEVFEGPVNAACSIGRGPCAKRMSCTVSRRLAEAQQSFFAALEKHTIETLAEELARCDASARRKGPGPAKA